MNILRSLAAPAILALSLGLAACATDNQLLLEADDAYSVTQDRVIRYVELPGCEAGQTEGCHDPAVKQAFKAQATANKAAVGAEEVDAAHAAYLKMLGDNGIDCNVGAACP